RPPGLRTGRRWHRGTRARREGSRRTQATRTPRRAQARCARSMPSLVHQLFVVALLERPVLLGDVALHALEQRATVFLGGAELLGAGQLHARIALVLLLRLAAPLTARLLLAR